MSIKDVKQRLAMRGKGGLFESTARSQNNKYTKYELSVVDGDKAILKLLTTIKMHSLNGHSLPVVLDEGLDQSKHYIDGDGADKIIEIKVNGKKLSPKEEKDLLPPRKKR